MERPIDEFEQGIRASFRYTTLQLHEIKDIIDAIEKKQVYKIDTLTGQDQIALGLKFDYREGFYEGLKQFYSQKTKKPETFEQLDPYKKKMKL
jgi:hypothetical protein